MKELIAGIVLVLVVGIGGFLYRNEVERPLANAPAPSAGANNGVACTADAKICPDGSAVGRTGPDCAFAPCPPPNAELAIGSTTLDFVLPSGYQKTSNTSSQLIAEYQQSGTNGSIIRIYDYPIPAGEGPDKVMLAETTFDPSGLQATSTSEFTNVAEGNNTFSEIQIGRYEGQIQTAYYLPQTNDVLRFDIVENGVTDWTDPNLNASTLPQHQALQQMLATLQISN